MPSKAAVRERDTNNMPNKAAMLHWGSGVVFNAVPVEVMCRDVRGAMPRLKLTDHLDWSLVGKRGYSSREDSVSINVIVSV